MTINNEKVFLDGLWDWGCLDGCFGETKIAPTDIDGFVERNGHFLVLETKHPNTRIPYGQEITFKEMIKTGLFTVVIIWGEKNIPEEIELRTSKAIWHFNNANIKNLYWIVSEWFKWAEKQTSAPEFKNDKKEIDHDQEMDPESHPKE